MKRTVGPIAFLSVLVCLQVGCDMKPVVPKTTQGKAPKVLAVNPDDAEEVAAVTSVEAARINYEFRLKVLQTYYEKTGNMDKRNWAVKETENLRMAQTFTWANLPQILPPEGESLAGTDEGLLVEYAVAARKRYTNAVAELAEFYQRRDPVSYKTRRVENLKARFDQVHTYMYFRDAEMPGPDIEPVEVIPEADQMYKRALKLHEDGKGILRIFVTTSYNKQRQALALLRELVGKYPRSTKVALAAFYIGEIYKEYFNENVRSVQWYQRAWQWDPNITKPARFQAATTWDLRLQQKDKAIECYRLVLEHERFNKSNIRFARQRIRRLMQE